MLRHTDSRRLRKNLAGPGGLGRSGVFSAPNPGDSEREKKKAGKPRILVIDNESGIHRVLRLALQACGYETIDAMTGSSR